MTAGAPERVRGANAGTAKTGYHQDSDRGAPVAPPVDELQVPCRTDPDHWWSDDPADIADAKTRCGPCPIRAGCLRVAIANAEPAGVWGGQLIERGVVREKKRRRPGRPSGPAAGDVERSPPPAT